MSDFKSMGKRFTRDFEDVLENSLKPELEELLSKTYESVELEVENLIDSGKIQASKDINAKKVFKNLK